MVVWEETSVVDEEREVGLHAALCYDKVAAAGQPSQPLEFPTPTVHRGARREVVAMDHRSGKLHRVSNVLMRVGTSSTHLGGSQSFSPDRAYLIKKKLGKSIYGVVRLCVVLKKRNLPPIQSDSKVRRRRHNRMIRDEDAEWESTEELAVIKASSWAKIRHLRGRHLEDPIKEIAAMQLVGNYHTNVQGVLEALQDDDYLYTVMPYCSEGDLFGRIMGSERRMTSQSTTGTDQSDDFIGCKVDEEQARLWFRQLLSGLFHLQRKGVCHRDISLENCMVDENDRLVILDLGMALRVPYADPDNIGCVTDVSEGTERLLITAQGQGGKLMYLAPEIVAREEVFDGFAIDLWAAGVVLFVLLVGLAPFRWAHESDKRFAKMANGHLKELMENIGIPLSDEACDLLQNMFWRDPRRRFTLAQVMQHPWVLNKKLSAATVPVVQPTKVSRMHKMHWFAGLSNA